MKLRGSQVVLLIVLFLLTVGAFWGLVALYQRNRPVLQAALARAPTPVPTPLATPTPAPTATSQPTPTPTSTPTPTATPIVPQTRYDQQVAQRPDDAGLRVLRGEVYLKLRAYTWAMADFDAALQLDASLPEAHLGRGQALFYLKEWTAALTEFEQAIALRPELAAAHAWRGYLLMQRRQMGPALEALRQAVLLAPADPALYTMLAEALVLSRSPDEARAAATQALELDDRYVPAYVARALALAELGDVDTAQVDLEQALRISPYAPVAFNAQAWLYAWYRGDHLADAERLARRAIAGAEDDLERAGYLDTLGWALYRQGRTDEAVAALEEAARLATVEGQVTYPEILAHLERVRAAQ